ncbi:MULTISPECIES: hypothetical protein [unclassified Arcicella]|uniref:tetratricopeptide repeat protein n=1 Tax=unclassified Arcicella TaxID=2644986 RepID=UPI002854621B|nr:MULTISPECIES: hypothetical protein [unclassified Arcicella]MDR6563138.1 tetratricopeptide (TPR) repeat protein [Arcicella sp. BE51]MDR6811711.1 tetratricopeptide (TPR) repeat protein [Arcicella sp. BE140]MDR6823236.1 tetratricopeptide (TPR) repeat protein [Arcicella sp. BE139]
MKRNRLLLFILFATIFNVKSQSKIMLRLGYVPVSANIKFTRYNNIILNDSLENKNVEVGVIFGKTAPFPNVLSKKFDKTIKQSQVFYKRRDFVNAYKILEKAYKEEPNNLFVLENYAKALYKIDKLKAKSFEVYKSLIEKSDKINIGRDSLLIVKKEGQLIPQSNDEILLIDAWFPEAYWKLGTLYMDEMNWEKAMIEIGRFLHLCTDNNENKAVLEQAMAYLAECAFELHNEELTSLYVKKTLAINANNTYVKNFIK